MSVELMMKPITAYIGCFAITFLAAWLGSVASIQAGTFYQSLQKPSWAPPGSVFGPVWTLLYLSMAIAAGMAITSTGVVRGAAILYVIQLILNSLWSWTFFRWESGLSSMITIIALWISIFGTILAFWRLNPASGMLMLPYLAWVSFAAILNGTIWKMNTGVL